MPPTTSTAPSGLESFRRALESSEGPVSTLIAGGRTPADPEISGGLFPADHSPALAMTAAAEPEPDSHVETLPAELPPLTDEEAHRLIRRLARYEDELGALKANYEALKREIEDKRQWVLGNDGLRLQEWVAAQLRGRKRSVRTLHGVAGFRAQADRLVILDERLALEWAREALPAAIVEKLDGKRIDLEQFRLINEHGEAEFSPPDGLAIEPGTERFYVKSGGKGSGPEDE